MDAKKDLVAELDLPSLFESRGEAAKKQKEAAQRLIHARASHFVLLWGGGCLMILVSLLVWEAFPRSDPAGSFVLAVSVLLWLWMWVAACLPTETVRRRQAEANALTLQLKGIDERIAFCHLVLDEAKRVKVRRYAEAWVTKELS